MDLVIRSPGLAALLAGIALLPVTHFKPIAGLKLSEIMILLSLALLLLNAPIRRFTKLPRLFSWSMTLFLLACLLSWTVALATVQTTAVIPKGSIYAFPLIGLLTVGRFLSAIAIVWLVVQMIQDSDKAKLLAKAHVIGGTLAASIGIGLYVLSVLGLSISCPLFRSFGGKAGVWGIRLAGMAYEPGAFGNYLVSVLPITVAFFLSSPRWARACLWLLALFVQSLALILTFSTGAMGCTAAAVALLLVVCRSRLSFARLATLLSTGGFLLVIVAVIAQLASINYQQIFTVVSKIGTQSVDFRLATNHYLLRMFFDKPTFGIGIGNFAHTFGLYTQGSSLSYFPSIYPADWRANNDYLTILAETGIIGFACFALLLLSILKEILRVLRASQGFDDGILWASVACAILGLLGQCWVAFTILNPYTWLLVGLLIASRRWLPDTSPEFKENSDWKE